MVNNSQMLLLDRISNPFLGCVCPTHLLGAKGLWGQSSYKREVPKGAEGILCKTGNLLISLD